MILESIVIGLSILYCIYVVLFKDDEDMSRTITALLLSSLVILATLLKIVIFNNEYNILEMKMLYVSISAIILMPVLYLIRSKENIIISSASGITLAVIFILGAIKEF